MTTEQEIEMLPLDTSEVVISRKGSRSGDSDYFLNGKKTRLRELQTLLMKAAVDASTARAMGCGPVGWRVLLATVVKDTVVFLAWFDWLIGGVTGLALPDDSRGLVTFLHHPARFR